MLPISLTKAMTAGSVNAIATSQTPTSPGNLTLTASPVTLTTQRRVLISCAGADAARTFTVYGTNDGGSAIMEQVAGSNGGTSVSTLDFRTVTRIAVDAATAGAVQVGTNATGSTPWFMPNFHMAPFKVDVRTQLSGSVTYNVETTSDNYWTAPQSPYAQSPKPNVLAVVTGATAGADTVLDVPVTGWRITITANTGTLTAQSVQEGIANY